MENEQVNNEQGLGMSQPVFEITMEDLADAIYQNAADKGFYKEYNQIRLLLVLNAPELVPAFDAMWLSNRLMLVVSELAEGLEAIRKGNFDDKPKSGGLGEELADAQIRLLDLMKHRGYSPTIAVTEKMLFNAKREFKHGGKVL